MLLRRDFTNLHFGGVVVTNSPSETVTMAQTEHSTMGENPNGPAQGRQITPVTLPTFSFKKKKNLSVRCVQQLIANTK
jgi:hypothetical protein